MTPREAILEVIDRNDELALALARAIRQLEGWAISDTESRHRIRQCLRGTAGRHFCVDWVPVFAGLCVDFEESEPVTGLIDAGRRDREYALRQEAREMRTVRPSQRDGRRRAG